MYSRGILVALSARPRAHIKVDYRGDVGKYQDIGSSMRKPRPYLYLEIYHIISSALHGMDLHYSIRYYNCIQVQTF